MYNLDRSQGSSTLIETGGLHVNDPGPSSSVRRSEERVHYVTVPYVAWGQGQPFMASQDSHAIAMSRSASATGRPTCSSGTAPAAPRSAFSISASYMKDWSWHAAGQLASQLKSVLKFDSRRSSCARIALQVNQGTVAFFFFDKERFITW
jgi:hypothetical protein